MNFDTKYLIRWGIPGWIMAMILLPYFITKNFEVIMTSIKSTTDLLGYGAILTALGVPLGYLLNQIHHFLFWVFPKLITNSWDKYFEEELKLDEYFSKAHVGERERYRYLLSRKHELGGISTSLGISFFVIIITNCITEEVGKWPWVYCLTIYILFLILLICRDYSSKNIEKYHERYLSNNENEQRKASRIVLP